MHKRVLLAALLCGIAGAGHAQRLYGTSTAAGADRSLNSFDPVTNTFGVVIKTFEYYQPTSTKDTTHKVLYYLAPNMSSTNTNPDTLVIVKLADSTMSKRPLAKGALTLPQFYNGKLYGLCANGLAMYDPATSQYSIADSSVRAAGVHSSDIDLTRGRYLFMKRNASSALADTLFVYTIASRSLAKFAVATNGNSNEMAYSPTSNKVVFLGVPANTANVGIYSFNLTTQQLSPESIFTGTSNGTLVNSGTMDAVNNRYFVVRLTNNSGTGFNILEYRLNTMTLVDHLVGSPGMGFTQYFDNMHIPPATPAPSAIGAVPAAPLFTMYPNPAGSELHLRLDQELKATLGEVMDLSGRVILTQHLSGNDPVLQLGSLAAGHYFLRLTAKVATYTRPFVKD